MSVVAMTHDQVNHEAAKRPRASIRPIRVLHVMPSLYQGGMERALVRLIIACKHFESHQLTSRHITHAVCICDDGDNELIAQCQSTVSTWILGRWSSKTNRLMAWRRLHHLIKRFRPDIIHARSTGTWFDATIAKLCHKKVKLVIGFHGRENLSPLPWRRRLINRWVARRSDAVLTVSSEAARMIHHQWGAAEDKLFTIVNGVDTKRFRPADDANHVQQLRKQLQLPPDCRPVICVANLLPIKAIDVLLHAWRNVAMTDPVARLLIVGDGPLRHDLEQLSRQLRLNETVQFLGNRQDIPELLRAGELFVLPSRYEGASNAILEAMASGLPVVACQVGGNSELIESNRTGWLVPPDNPHRLAEILSIALNEYSARRRMGRAARDTVLKRFALQQWVHQYTAFYSALLTENRTLPTAFMEELPCVE